MFYLRLEATGNIYNEMRVASLKQKDKKTLAASRNSLASKSKEISEDLHSLAIVTLLRQEEFKQYNTAFPRDC